MVNNFSIILPSLRSTSTKHRQLKAMIKYPKTAIKTAVLGIMQSILNIVKKCLEAKNGHLLLIKKIISQTVLKNHEHFGSLASVGQLVGGCPLH